MMLCLPFNQSAPFAKEDLLSDSNQSLWVAQYLRPKQLFWSWKMSTWHSTTARCLYCHRLNMC